MSAVAALGLTAFFICFLVTPIVRDLFLHARLVDNPDNERKFHLKSIPRVGGIPVVIGYVGSLALIFMIAPHGASLYVHHRRLLLSLLPATALIFVTGLIDDLMTLKPWQKLAGQCLAAGLAVSLGARMSLHGPAWLAMALSFVWLIACANALNLIDGMDGLASGVALFATVATFCAAVLGGNLGLAVATVPLAGCLFAFLRYNFHPASIFLGDCGSLTIGFMLGCFGLIWSQRTGTVMGMAAPLMALGLPLIDVAIAIGRRFLRSVPIFKGDRRHIHHRVLARSVTTRKAVFILYGVCAVASMLALLLSVSAHPFKWLISAVFCVLAIVGVNSLRYVEFSAAKRSLSGRSMLKMIREEIYLHELAVALEETESLDALWGIACEACEELQCAMLCMRLNGRDFYQAMDIDAESLTWKITVPLGANGELILTRIGDAGSPKFMVALLDCLQTAIVKRECSADHAVEEHPAYSYRGAA